MNYEERLKKQLQATPVAYHDTTLLFEIAVSLEAIASRLSEIASGSIIQSEKK